MSDIVGGELYACALIVGALALVSWQMQTLRVSSMDLTSVRTPSWELSCRNTEQEVTMTGRKVG